MSVEGTGRQISVPGRTRSLFVLRDPGGEESWSWYWLGFRKCQVGPLAEAIFFLWRGKRWEEALRGGGYERDEY